MSSELQLERRIFDRWRKDLFLEDETGYFLEAQIDLQSEGQSVRFASVKSRLRNSKVVLLADHLLCGITQDMLRETLIDLALVKKETVFMTDRVSQRFLAKWNASSLAKGDARSWRKAMKLSPAANVENIICLFEWLRKKGCQFYGVNRPSSLRAADDRAARFIRSKSKEGKKVLFWTGLLRVTPSHLPKELEMDEEDWAVLSADGGSSRLFQKTYSSWIRFGTNIFLSQRLSPLESIECERLANDERNSLPGSHLIRKEFDRCCDVICKELRQKKLQPRFKIYHPFSLKSLKKLQEANWSKDEEQFIIERVERGECASLPASRSVLISSLDPSEIAEEASHSIHLNSRFFDPTRDFMVLEEAFGFFGSLLCYPYRIIPSEEEGSEWQDFHREGYELGRRLFNAWEKSAEAKKEIISLWEAKTENQEDTRRILSKIKSISKNRG